MRAAILDGTPVRRHSIVGAGAVLTQGKGVGEGALWLGNRARFVRKKTSQQIEQIDHTARWSGVLAASYCAEITAAQPKLSDEFDRRALRV